VKFNTRSVEMEGKVVTGAPYSAQAETETTQVLADGNRISHKVTASVARDSMGRTRREQKFDLVGPWASAEKMPSTITINDPVAGARYILEPDSKTTIRLPGMNSQRRQELEAKLKAERRSGTVAVATGEGNMMMIRTDAAAKESRDNVRTESLGTSVIEGVQAEGRRITEIIPAGKIGNEKPIEIVNETWYSPELQTTIMSKHSDPRTGDVTYTLKNISRSEPDPALFTPPADYKLREEGKGMELRMDGR
jgi:hypothetical protein